MLETFGLWWMLLEIIWEILMKTMVLILPSIKDNTIMIFVQFQILTLQLTTNKEFKTVDLLTLLI